MIDIIDSFNGQINHFNFYLQQTKASQWSFIVQGVSDTYTVIPFVHIKQITPAVL